ncbi:MAG: hypothetical protein ACYS21_10305 [Planctomycetota bacterium]
MLVAYCEKQGKKLTELSLDELKQHCSLIEPDVYENLGAAKVVGQYVTEGAAGSRQAKEQIAYWTDELARR